MTYYSKEVISQVKQIDLLSYLENNEPDELVLISRDNYKTKTHDSLKISNGKWFWFSRGIGGVSALEYLIQVREHSFLQAVEKMLSFAQDFDLTFPSPSQKTETKKLTEQEKIDRFILPVPASNNNKAIAYLLERGISESIINKCIADGIIYQDMYNNVVFVGKDINNNSRYAGIRGTSEKRFMQEASGSDKTYSFRIEANDITDSIYMFESAIDLLSYATLLESKGLDYRKYTFISLAGVYQPAKKIEESKVPLALAYYLNQHPNIKNIYFNFDNDDAGRKASKAISTMLPSQYEIIYKPPTKGKDWNDYLCFFLNQDQKKRYEIMGRN